MNNTLKNLVKALSEKNLRNETIWTKTSGENEFKIKMNKASLTVDHWNDEDGENYDLTIYNENGEQIEYVHVMTNDAFDKENFDLLKKHYESVNKTYYKVDETLDSILNEIENKKIVGNN